MPCGFPRSKPRGRTRAEWRCNRSLRRARWKIGAVRFSLNKAARPTCSPSRSLINRLVIPKGVQRGERFLQLASSLEGSCVCFFRISARSLTSTHSLCPFTPKAGATTSNAIKALWSERSKGLAPSTRAEWRCNRSLRKARWRIGAVRFSPTKAARPNTRRVALQQEIFEKPGGNRILSVFPETRGGPPKRASSLLVSWVSCCRQCGQRSWSKHRR
jgi:hypothetical protein